jgi:hypothetical protein
VKRACPICKKKIVCIHKTLRKECSVCTPKL